MSSILRLPKSSDLDIFFEQQMQEEALKMAEFEPRARTPFFKHWQKILADDSVVIRSIVVDTELVGNIVCFYDSTQWNVGYWLGREYWGRGIASKALKEFVLILSERPLFAHVASSNIGSRRVLEKCGFAATSTKEAGECLYRLDD